MNSASAKIALAPLVLAATWSTAHADTTLTATLAPPSSIGTVDHVRLFAEDYTPASFPAAGTYIPGSAVVGADLGPVTGPSSTTGSTTVSYAAGTSAYVGLFGTIGTNQLLISSFVSSETTADSYLSSGTNFSTLFNAIVNGDSAPLVSLAGNQEDFFSINGIAMANFDPGTASTQSLSSYVFTRGSNGTVTDSAISGNVASLNVAPINPTPEPASMAALGVGVLALIRRRRKLA